MKDKICDFQMAPNFITSALQRNMMKIGKFQENIPLCFLFEINRVLSIHLQIHFPSNNFFQ